MSVDQREYPIPEPLRQLVYGSYLSVVEQLHGLDARTRTIDVAQDLLTAANITFDAWPRVVVTGSKGKGSTAVLLASILEASGEHVGLITSPHLRRFNERIRIDGQCVSDDELDMARRDIAPMVESIASRTQPPRYLGPGGVILALAARIFARTGVNVVVIEAGRGGEHDEARLARANVAVLTPIMMEHPDKLGPTIDDIARAKVRIATPGFPIVSAAQSQSVRDIITREAAALESPVHWAARQDVVEHERHDAAGVVCDMRIANRYYPDLRVALAGEHQTENAALAIQAAHLLETWAVSCSRTGIYAGMSRVRWPGRAQILQRHPWVFLDAAINDVSARSACHIAQHYGARRVIAVVGVPQPKDLDGLCREVGAFADKIITTEVVTPTLTWYDNAAEVAARYCRDVQHVAPADRAFKQALAEAGPDDGILLLGTISFVGSAVQHWNADTCALW